MRNYEPRVKYTISNSPFVAEIGITKYFFSSLYNLGRFMDRLQESRKSISESLSNRFKLDIEFDELADLILYREIEKRGFYITIGKEIATCQETVKLIGKKAIRQISA